LGRGGKTGGGGVVSLPIIRAPSTKEECITRLKFIKGTLDDLGIDLDADTIDTDQPEILAMIYEAGKLLTWLLKERKYGIQRS
jgi:hypothetical protein